MSERIVGMHLEFADEQLRDRGEFFRITRLDGIPQPLTANFCRNRVNIEVANNKVTRIVSRG